MSLSSADYARALDLLRAAAVEFPDDAELAELEKLATDGAKRKGEADRFITESQELFAQQKPAKALELLRQAYGLDKNNSLARSILANALVEHAQSIVETDWWEAETLANEALALNPAHPTAKTIENLILARKKVGSVDEWVAQTSKLQAAGNLSAALSQIAEGFEVHPREPRLLQIQDAIQRDYGVQRRQARRRDLDDLRRTASEIDAATDVAAKAALAERIKAVTVKYSTDGEILSVANALLLRLGHIGVAQKSAAAAAGSEGSPAIYQAPAPKDAEVLLAATIPFAPKPIAAGKASTAVAPGVAKTSKARENKAKTSMVPPGKIAATSPEPQPGPSQTVVPAPKLSAPGAKVAPPSFQAIEAPRSNVTKVIVGSAAAAIIVVAAIFFFARNHNASPVAKTPAAAPTVSASDASAAAVSTPAVSTPVVPAPAVPAAALSTPVPTASEPAQPAVSSSSETSAGKVVTDEQPLSNPAPAPSASTASGHNLGTLVVVAGQDNAKVFLNGKLQRQLTGGGQLQLPNLELKDYVVQVSKSGFQDPPQQKIRVRAGEPVRLVFNLQPNAQPQPRLASLTIQGGAPGTAVLVDQALVGTVQPDGTFAVSTVNPGDHIVELRRERFKPRQFKKHFVMGGAIALAAADATLEAATAELKITFAPADAKVAIAKTGELPTMVSSGVPLSLAPGTYTLTARTVERFTRSSTLEVVAGQSKTLDLSLAPNGMSKWENPGAWKHEKDSFVRQGGDFVLYGVAPTAGSFAFSAMLTKGHLLQWVFNYTDPKNYILFQLDDNNFYRAVIRNGKKTDEIIVPDKGDKKSFRALHIRVSPTEIVHQIGHGDSWTVVDRWTQPGANLSQGKFGFYLPGNDQVALSGFAHYADLNIH